MTVVAMQIHYAQLYDLSKLCLEHRLWVELHKKRLEREMTYQNEQNMGCERQPKRKHQRGSRGMDR